MGGNNIHVKQGADAIQITKIESDPFSRRDARCAPPSIGRRKL